jgi:hypothetical protein
MDNETKKLLNQIIDVIAMGSLGLWFIVIDLFVLIVILAVRL